MSIILWELKWISFEKEVSDNSISVRRKFKGDQGSLKLNDFIQNIKKEIDNRIL